MHVTLDSGEQVAVAGAVAAMVRRLLRAQATFTALGAEGHYQVRLHVQGETVKAQVLTALREDRVQ